MLALRRLLEGSTSHSDLEMNSLAGNVVVTALFGLVMLLTACYLVRRQALKGMA
jgi:hypothetical protein